MEQRRRASLETIRRAGTSGPAPRCSIRQMSANWFCPRDKRRHILAAAVPARRQVAERGICFRIRINSESPANTGPRFQLDSRDFHKRRSTAGLKFGENQKRPARPTSDKLAGQPSQRGHAACHPARFTPFFALTGERLPLFTVSSPSPGEEIWPRGRPPNLKSSSGMREDATGGHPRRHRQAASPADNARASEVRWSHAVLQA